jgi:hypothetical protein
LCAADRHALDGPHEGSLKMSSSTMPPVHFAPITFPLTALFWFNYVVKWVSSNR